MSDFSIPSEWILTELGNYIYLKNGFAFKSSDYLESSQTTIPIIRISDIQNNLVTTDSATHVLPNKLAESFTISRGDLLIAMSGATTGKVGIFNESKLAYQNQRVGNLKLINEELGNKSFRNYLIQSLSKKILEIAYGGAQPNISGKTIEEILIPLPPKAEQEKIAELLDSQLAQVEAIKSQLNAIPDILKKFRQSVLADAVSGRLIGLEKKFQDLKAIKFEDLILKSGNGIAKRSGTDGKNITVLRLADFKNSERITGNEKQITLTEKEINQYQLNQNDILVVRVNGSIDLAGKFILYEQNKNIEAYCDHFIRFQLNQEKILPQFMIYIANFGKGRDYLQSSLSTSAGQNTINQTSIKNLTLKLPSVEEQREIIKRVEQLFAYADTIESQVNNALQRLNQLTQSILHQAFTGKLTAHWRTQNPHLITGDNSAENLLQQIQTAKQQATPIKKPKKVKNAD